MDINEKFEELYEETKLEEHCGECEMGITEEVSVKEFDALKKQVNGEQKMPISFSMKWRRKKMIKRFIKKIWNWLKSWIN